MGVMYPVSALRGRGRFPPPTSGAGRWRAPSSASS